jgi:hypothetical protein
VSRPALHVLVAICLPALAADASRLPRAQAVRVSDAPVIDGRVDDAAWAAAPAQDGFTQVQPAQGGAPSEQTSFRLAYDDAHLYVAVSCLDSDPRRITSRLTRRDRDIETDWVSVLIDSRNTRNSAFMFQLSAAGVQVDGQVFNDSEVSLDWDAVWKGKVRRAEDGWHAEFAIPLTVLRFSHEEEQVWGLQVHRNVSRKREQHMWAFDGSGRVFGVSHFGYVEGLRGLRPRRTLELRPYASAGVVSRNARGAGFLGLGTDASHDARFDLGVDAKVGLTRRLTLDLSVNPDFGQVEADQVVLNLSRFETFFPEKRPFFLEGTDIFSTAIQLFYPRRIGRPALGLGIGDTLQADGSEYTVTEGSGALRLWTAAKMTGEVGSGLSLGVLAALVGDEEVTAVDGSGQERDLDLAPMRAYGVVRARQAVGDSGSFVGVTATGVTRLDGHVQRAEADHDGYVQAVDAFVKSANGRFVSTAQVAVSERVGGPTHRRDDGRACSEEDAATDPGCVPIARADGTHMGPGTVGVGVQARMNHETERTLLKVEYVGHTAKFDANDLGFAPRFNLNEGKVVGGIMKKQPDRWTNFRGVFPFVVGSVAMDGTPQFLLAGVDLEATFRNFTATSPELYLIFPGGFDIYETLDGARLERPMAFEGYWQTDTNRARALSLSGNLQWYLALDDERRRIQADATLTWQAASNVELSLGTSIGAEHAVRFYDCTTDSGRACLVEGGLRHYRFADLDSRFLSLTLRGTLTLRPELSFQAYAQYFLADGEYSDYRDLDTMGERPEIRLDALQPSSFRPEGDDGFEGASINANLVARWELRPGSTLYAVYTRAQESPVTAPGKLDRGPTEDAVLLKLVYFLN